MPKHKIKREIAKSCEYCGNEFLTGSSIKKHCSNECRILSVIEKHVFYKNMDQCWNWPLSKNTQTGYGQISSWENGKRKLLSAHRVSYAAHNQGIPEGMHVLHKCDNRLCINPNHLFIGSHIDNIDDMLKKGRNKTGLTVDQVVLIKKSTKTSKELSAEYGVTISCISAIRHKRTWKRINPTD